MQEYVEQISAPDFRKSPRRDRSRHPDSLDVPRIATQEFYEKTSEDVLVISAQSLSTFMLQNTHPSIDKEPEIIW